MRVVLKDELQMPAGSTLRPGAQVDLPLQAAEALIGAGRARRLRRDERRDDLSRLSDALSGRDTDEPEPSDEDGADEVEPDEAPEAPTSADWAAIDWQSIDGVADGTEAEILEWLEASEFQTYAALAASDLTALPGIGDAKRDAAHSAILEEATRGDE